jgi:hypothetical protein
MTLRIHVRATKKPKNHGVETPFVVFDPDESEAGRLVVECFTKSKARKNVFARLMGVNPETLRRYLSGKSRPPGLAVRAAVCAAMMSGVCVYFPRANPDGPFRIVSWFDCPKSVPDPNLSATAKGAT